MRFHEKWCVAFLVSLTLLSSCASKSTSSNDFKDKQPEEKNEQVDLKEEFQKQNDSEKDDDNAKDEIDNKNDDKTAKTKNEFYLVNGLRDIGEFKQITVLDGADDLEFVPSDDYGEILYFVGDIKRYSPVDSDVSEVEFSTDYYRYGLCTKDGTIIKNAIYEYVNVTPSGLIVLTHPGIEDKSVSWEESNYTKPQTIISRDGSWKIDLPAETYDNAWIVSHFTENDLNVIYQYNSEGGADYYFYNNNGELVSEISGYNYLNETQYGLYVANKYYSNGENTYEFINLDGEVIFGPYEYAMPFSKSDVAVVKIQGKYGLINKDGEYVVQPEYENIDTVYSDTGNDVRFSGVKDSKRYLFDSDGVIIKQFETDKWLSIFGSKDKLVYRMYGDNYESYYRRFEDDSILVCSHCNNSPNSVINDGEYYVCRDDENNTACLIDYTGHRISVLDGFLYLSYALPESEFIIYTAQSDDPVEESHMYGGYFNDCVLYDIHKDKEIERFERTSYVSLVEGERKLIVPCYSKADAGKIEGKYIYDIDTGEKYFENAINILPYKIDGKTYYSVYTLGYIKLYDADFNEIMSMINKNNI